jgi:hypothetical protein
LLHGALTPYNLKAEITATARCGMMQFTVDKDDSLYLLIMPNSDKQKGMSTSTAPPMK